MRSKPKHTDESPWGYAFAGVVALTFAALIQFALAELPPNVLKYLPIGKLAMTVPLAAWGLALIARDLVANLGKRPVVVRKSREPAPHEAPSEPASSVVVVSQDAETVTDPDPVSVAEQAPVSVGELALESVSGEELDLEVGEPLPEDLGPKIPALRGRFSWLLGDESYRRRARRGEA